jgi:hypothetical protein
MAGVAPEPPVLSEARAQGLRRMLLAVLALGAVLVLLAVGTAFAGAHRFAVVVGVIGLVLAGSSGVTLRALPERGALARRGCVVTAVLLIVLAVPLVSVWVGLVMAVAGVGLLFMVYAPEREDA